MGFNLDYEKNETDEYFRLFRSFRFFRNPVCLNCYPKKSYIFPSLFRVPGMGFPSPSIQA